MAVYNPTVTTSAAQEKGLAFVTAQENAIRAAKTPPESPLTQAQYLQARVDDLITKYRKAYREDLRSRVGVALDAANNATVTQVATLLGVTE